MKKQIGTRVSCSVAVDVPYVAAHVGVAKAKASPTTGHATSTASVPVALAGAPASPVAPQIAAPDSPPVISLEQ